VNSRQNFAIGRTDGKVSQTVKPHLIGRLQTRGQGFTLLELLAVITTVAILAAILIPALSAAKAKVERLPCVSNLKQLHRATMVYGDDKISSDYNTFNQPLRRSPMPANITTLRINVSQSLVHTECHWHNKTES
jgi:prepilin-type N-terminal cleavage/methylation domain-containing protein